jgi:hypothetical protein
MINEKSLFDDIFVPGDVYRLRDGNPKIEAKVSFGGDIAFFDLSKINKSYSKSLRFRLPVMYKDFRRKWKIVRNESLQHFLNCKEYYSEYDIVTDSMTKTTVFYDRVHIPIDFGEYMSLIPFGFYETRTVLDLFDDKYDFTFHKTHKFTDSRKKMLISQNHK